MILNFSNVWKQKKNWNIIIFSNKKQYEILEKNNMKVLEIISTIWKIYTEIKKIK